MRGGADALVRRVCTDSREVRAGDLFVAISGPKFDAHAFLADVFEAGAAGAIVARAGKIAPEVAVRLGGRLVAVDDTVAALGLLASHYRDGLRGKVIAVTGSNGKTTTKRMIQHILGKHFKGSCSPKSFNNNIGVPLTLLAAEEEDDYVICEVGTNAPGEIAELSAICRPDIAVIVSVGQTHLEKLGSVELVAVEKASMLGHVRDGGCAILWADSAPLQQAVRQYGCRKILFGEGAAEGTEADRPTGPNGCCGQTSCRSVPTSARGDAPASKTGESLVGLVQQVPSHCDSRDHCGGTSPDGAKEGSRGRSESSSKPPEPTSNLPPEKGDPYERLDVTDGGMAGRSGGACGLFSFSVGGPKGSSRTAPVCQSVFFCLSDFAGRADGVTFRVGGVRVELPQPGRHNASNALAAIAVAVRMGLTVEQAGGDLADFAGVEMRLESMRIGAVRVINDAYNANPSSMIAAAEVLAVQEGSRRVMVAGDMLELGSQTMQIHEETGRRIAGFGTNRDDHKDHQGHKDHKERQNTNGNGNSRRFDHREHREHRADIQTAKKQQENDTESSEDTGETPMPRGGGD